MLLFSLVVFRFVRVPRHVPQNVLLVFFAADADAGPEATLHRESLCSKLESQHEGDQEGEIGK